MEGVPVIGVSSGVVAVSSVAGLSVVVSSVVGLSVVVSSVVGLSVVVSSVVGLSVGSSGSFSSTWYIIVSANQFEILDYLLWCRVSCSAEQLLWNHQSVDIKKV